MHPIYNKEQEEQIHSAQQIYMEIHKMFFLYNNKITFIGSYKFQDSPTPTRRRLQPPNLQAPT
jgi:hypothetical protein